ncbi:MAG: HlyD family secretion protein, partial [Armatimonadota bacterium]
MKRRFAFVAVLLPILAGCRPAQPPKDVPGKMPLETTPVRTSRAGLGSIGREVRLTGSLAADNTIQLATRITARVLEAPFREGMAVRKGDILIRQDTIDLANQQRAAEAAVAQAAAGVASAEAAVKVAETRLAQARTQSKIQSTSSAGTVADAEQQLRSAQAQLEIARRPQRGQEVVVAESAVAQAQANLDKAAQDRKRYAQLVADGAASRAQLDQFVNQEKVAKAALESANAQLDIARTGGREESVRSAETAVRRAEVGVQLAKSNVQLDRVREDEVRSAEATLEQSRSSLRQAKANLASANASLARSRQDIENAVLRSPIDGVVASRSA